MLNVLGLKLPDERSGVAAGGSLETTPASPLKKLWLIVELLVLFCAAPVAMHHVIRHEKIPIFVALLRCSHSRS